MCAKKKNTNAKIVFGETKEELLTKIVGYGLGVESKRGKEQDLKKMGLKINFLEKILFLITD